MATSELIRPRTLDGDLALPQISATEFVVTRILAALASLKLTVGLFAFAIFLIFMGTLAQKDHDVWAVVNDLYFRKWFAQIDFVAFERLVQVFFKEVKWNLKGWVYVPGGNMLGTMLLINLLAAHAVRFKVAASGKRLSIGLVAIAAGILMTYLAIQSGMNNVIESELSPAFCNLLWQFVRGSLALLAIGIAYVIVFLRGHMRAVEWWLLLGINVVLAALVIWLLANPSARLDDAGLRILWQLIKGSAASIALLVGCILVFRKRAGIVLLHGGIALLMLGELFTGITAQESQMQIPIGGTASYSQDFRSTELAIIDHSNAEHDQVTVVPASLLRANVGAEAPIDDSQLPFKIQVHRWLPNSQVRNLAAGESSAATAGFGKDSIAEESAQATGVGKRSKFVDSPSTYVDLIAKQSGKSLGTYLVSARLNDQPVEVEGKTYDLSLRYKRVYYPYSLALKDFQFRRYVGTDTAKDYRSIVVLKDRRHNVDREVPIWMNNPLRYEGTTFYQSDFDHDTEKLTVLSAVNNPSWMTPYVACMLVATGMLAHFGLMLFRFLKRRANESSLLDSAAEAEIVETNGRTRREAKKFRRQPPALPVPAWKKPAVWFPTLIVLVFGAYVASHVRMPKSKPSEMQVYEFGKLPLAYQGRIKPYDTLARNTLQIFSGTQRVITMDKEGNKTYTPAIVWLLDALSGVPRADDAQIFRVDNLDLVDTLGLEHRPQHWRYSLNELETKPGVLKQQIDLVKQVPEEERSRYQSKVAELAMKHNLYAAVTFAFRQPPLSPDRSKLLESLQRTRAIIAQLREAQAPCAVPPKGATVEWAPLMEAEFEGIRDYLQGQPVNKATEALRGLLAAYARNDATEFNKQLGEYRRLMGEYEQSVADKYQELRESGVAKSEIVSQPKINFEVFYNQFSPFYYAAVLYFVAFVLGVFSWIGWSEPLRRASIWLLVMTLVLHTFALVARIYISGRPPITNLYSTAIFIGWGGVILALVFESIYRLGLGNIVASVIGFLTLLVAHFLSLDGDTFIVLQAVLDTQFWLATHVVTINMGYAATYTTGLIGVVYVLLGHVFPVLDEDGRHTLSRMLYGTLCFAMYFSFVGTVLGGLWGDDSWGRFWGWDPKENGALMIVLWNALVLHARWGGLVKARGLATLAIAGNIVTTWSYFGVNMLGEGLHAYGGSSTNTAMWLLAFAGSQLALIGLGMMPRRWFESLRLART